MFSVLDGDLDVLVSDKDRQEAIDTALRLSEYGDFPYYIQDEAGNLVYLIFRDVVWEPSKEFEGRIAFESKPSR